MITLYVKVLLSSVRRILIVSPVGYFLDKLLSFIDVSSYLSLDRLSLKLHKTRYINIQ